MNGGESFEILRDIYFALDRAFNALFDACETDEQRNALRMEYVAARNNFWIARSKVFQDNDPQVSTLLGMIRTAKARMDQELEDLKSIVTALNTISATVNLASKLTTLAA